MSAVADPCMSAFEGIAGRAQDLWLLARAQGVQDGLRTAARFLEAKAELVDADSTALLESIRDVILVFAMEVGEK